MYKRKAHTITLTLNVRHIELDVVFEGYMDFDEGIFDVEDTYLSEGRAKIAGKDAYKIPTRVRNHIDRHYDEEIHDAAWGSY
jgi:hypothetical protein